MRRVVFNADDLGLSPGVNRGIVASVRAGIVREVSLLVTGSSSVSGLEALRAASDDAGVGLHFSLTQGRALSGRLRGLTDDSGAFLGLPRALASCLARVPSVTEVRAELRAQLARLEALGIEPTHLNGHHHVHVFPVVRDAVLETLDETRLGHVRIPIEGLFTSRTLSARRALLALFAAAFRARLRRSVARTLPLVGLDLVHAGDHAAAFARLARRIRPREAEWIVHPHERDAELDSLDRDGRWGRRGALDELATLTSPNTRALLDELEILPSRYADMAWA